MNVLVYYICVRVLFFEAVKILGWILYFEGLIVIFGKNSIPGSWFYFEYKISGTYIKIIWINKNDD